jgi:GDP-D-mannose 3', 5'-epimerase
MLKALITGAGGFIGGHLVKRLKAEGYWVRGVGHALDLREKDNCRKALSVRGGFDEIYHFAADRGGVGYMVPGECDMMRNNALMDINLISEAVKLKKLPLFFYASSVCVYRDMKPGEKELSEADAYPAFPDNEYGWEKLYAERMLLAHQRKFGLPVRIGRFHTTFGPGAKWSGGREKAVDALCRKVAEAKNHGVVEVWGDGTAIREFNFIEDLIEGIRVLAKSDCSDPVNIGGSEYVTVEELVKKIIRISGKDLKIKYIPGAIGVQARNFSNRKIRSLGWRAKYKLEDGLKIQYDWIKKQIQATKSPD